VSLCSDLRADLELPEFAISLDGIFVREHGTVGRDKLFSVRILNPFSLERKDA
jgi:hypothetical protein